MPADGDSMFSFQDYVLDMRRGCLRRGQQDIDLRPKSFSVLRHLIENAGRLISKDELIDRVWADVTVSDVSLARCISDIRLALGDKDRRIVKTQSKRGYVFVAPVCNNGDLPRPDQ